MRQAVTIFSLNQKSLVRNKTIPCILQNGQCRDQTGRRSQYLLQGDEEHQQKGQAQNGMSEGSTGHLFIRQRMIPPRNTPLMGNCDFCHYNSGKENPVTNRLQFAQSIFISLK